MAFVSKIQELLNIEYRISLKKIELDEGTCYSEKPEADGLHCQCWYDCGDYCHFCGWQESEIETHWLHCDCGKGAPILFCF